MKLSHAVIIILLVFNLVATIWFGISNKPSNTQSPIEITSKNDLPKIITAKIRELLFTKVQAGINDNDFDALYNIFGPAAKAQFSKEDAYLTFDKISKYYHSIEEGAYTHSEFVNSKGNAKFYILYYAVKLSEKSELGTKGILKITIGVEGSDYQVYGFRLTT